MIDESWIGEYSFVYTMTSLHSEQDSQNGPKTMAFKVILTYDPEPESLPEPTGCSPDLFLSQLEDVSLQQGDSVIEVDLSTASNNDCRFDLELLDSISGITADASLF